MSGERMLTETEAAKMCSLTNEALQKQRTQKRGIPYTKTQSGRILYKKSDVEFYRDTRPRISSKSMPLNDLRQERIILDKGESNSLLVRIFKSRVFLYLSERVHYLLFMSLLIALYYINKQ